MLPLAFGLETGSGPGVGSMDVQRPYMVRMVLPCEHLFCPHWVCCWALLMYSVDQGIIFLFLAFIKA